MSLLVKRYARALFEAARAKGQADAVGDDLRALAGALRVRDVRAVLEPDVPANVRAATLTKLAEGRHELVVNTVRVLQERRRERVLLGMASAYRAMLLDERGEVEGTVESAKELDDDAVRALEEKASQMVGKKVSLNATIDPALIGGVRLRVGNTLWDGSVAAALDELERQLMQSAV